MTPYTTYSLYRELNQHYKSNYVPNEIESPSTLRMKVKSHSVLLFFCIVSTLAAAAFIGLGGYLSLKTKVVCILFIGIGSGITLLSIPIGAREIHNLFFKKLSKIQVKAFLDTENHVITNFLTKSPLLDLEDYNIKIRSILYSL